MTISAKIQALLSLPTAACAAMEVLYLRGQLNQLTASEGQQLAEKWCELSQLTSLDLSGNGLGRNVEAARALFAALPRLSRLTSLNLYGNDLGANAETARALAEALPGLSPLTSLDLGGNYLGANTEAARALFAVLPQLSPLTSLDLGANWLGKNVEAAWALFAALPQLSRLTSLDLSGNDLGQNAGAAWALLEVLPRLPQLTSLYLGRNDLGRNAEAARALFEVLPQLSPLTSLDLRGNDLGGFYNPEAARALAEVLPQLSRLTSLDLSGNRLLGPNVEAVWALFEGLLQLSRLTSLDLSKNQLYRLDGTGWEALGQAVAGHPSLQTLVIVEDGFNNTFQPLEVAQKALILYHCPWMQPVLAGSRAPITFTRLSPPVLEEKSVLDVVKLPEVDAKPTAACAAMKVLNLRQAQLAKLTASEGLQVAEKWRELSRLTSLDLSGNTLGENVEATRVLFAALALPGLSQLTSLYLGRNDLGQNAEVARTLFAALPGLSQLTSLHLGGNGFGKNAGVARALFEVLPRLSRLTSLDLDWNALGKNMEVARTLFEGLLQLSRLTSLDLSWNDLGENVEAARALFEVLPRLSRLTSLHLSWNAFAQSAEATRVLLVALPQLSQLTSLDVGYNYLDANAARALFAVLPRLSRLTSLHLGGNNLYENVEAVRALFAALPGLSPLTSLDLSGNYLGANTEVARALFEGLPRLSSLTSLDLSGNALHGLDSAGWEALGQAVVRHPSLQTLVILEEYSVDNTFQPLEAAQKALILHHCPWMQPVLAGSRAPITFARLSPPVLEEKSVLDVVKLPEVEVKPTAAEAYTSKETSVYPVAAISPADLETLRTQLSRLDNAVVLDAHGHQVLQSSLIHHAQMTVEEQERQSILEQPLTGQYYRDLQKYFLCCFASAQVILSDNVSVKGGNLSLLGRALHHLLGTTFPGISVFTSLLQTVLETIDERQRIAFLQKVLDIGVSMTHAEQLIEKTARHIVRAVVHAHHAECLTEAKAKEDVKTLLSTLERFQPLPVCSQEAREIALITDWVESVCGKALCLEPLTPPLQAAPQVLTHLISVLPVAVDAASTVRAEGVNQHAVQALQKQLEEAQQARLIMEQMAQQLTQLQQQHTELNATQMLKIQALQQEVDVLKKALPPTTRHTGAGGLMQVQLPNEHKTGATAFSEMVMSQLGAQVTELSGVTAAHHEALTELARRAEPLLEAHEAEQPINYERLSPVCALQTAVLRAVHAFIQTSPDVSAQRMALELKVCITKSRTLEALLAVLQARLPEWHLPTTVVFKASLIEECQQIPAVAAALQQVPYQPTSTATHRWRFFRRQSVVSEAEMRTRDFQRLLQALPRLNAPHFWHNNPDAGTFQPTDAPQAKEIEQRQALFSK